eukprot:309249-Hanusia_phi.AAC.1
MNKLSDLLRGEIAQAGFTEILTFGLCSHAEAFEKLNRPDGDSPASGSASLNVQRQTGRPPLCLPTPRLSSLRSADPRCFLVCEEGREGRTRMGGGSGRWKQKVCGVTVDLLAYRNFENFVQWSDDAEADQAV